MLCDVSAQSDPAAEEETPPSRLLRTRLTSISRRAFAFHPLSQSSSASSAPPAQLIYFLRVAQHRNRRRVDPCCSFFSAEFLTITPSLTPDKSNRPTCLPWLCAALADRWASQLIPFIFLAGAVDCSLLMSAPDGCFPAGEIKAVARRGGTARRSQPVQSDQSHCPRDRCASPSSLFSRPSPLQCTKRSRMS